MAKKNVFLDDNDYLSPFTGPNYRRKHAKSQVNGETMETQHNIILRNEIRKNS